jgi:transposase
MKRGRPKNDYGIYMTEKYLKQGLNLAEIAKLLNTSVRQVIRWREYKKNLSTGKHLTKK